MKEQFISYETAQLAKLKGFKEPVRYFISHIREIREDGFREYNWNNDDMAKGCYSAPTQSLLHKWLRDVHEIFVIIDLGSQEFSYKIYKGKNKMIQKYDTFKTINFNDSYENALEKGLQEGLKLIR